jgi:hypothetical protein
MSFIRVMKDKTGLSNMKNVFHPGYEGQNWVEQHEKCLSSGLWRTKLGWATGKMSFIQVMKDKTRLSNGKNVLHPGYEGQNPVGQHEKCPSSKPWRTNLNVICPVNSVANECENESVIWAGFYSFAPHKWTRSKGPRMCLFNILRVGGIELEWWCYQWFSSLEEDAPHGFQAN